MNAQQRRAAIAIGVVVVALLVIAAAVSLRPAGPYSSSAPSAAATASASPSPSAASGTPAATVAASATAVTSARYGYVSVGAGGLRLVDETGKTVQQYACGAAGRPCDTSKIAVSSDGKRVAFWASGSSGQWELRTFDAAAPTSVRTVAVLPPSFLGLRMVWSSDAQGIFDAALSGEGGFTPMYAVAGASGQRTMNVPGGSSIIAGLLEGAPDASRILAIDISANVVRIWPVADVAKAVDVGPGAGARITAAHWTPDATQVAWSVGDRFGTFIPQTDSSRTIYAASGGVRLIALRPDGTAALLSAPGGLQVTDMQTGTSTRVQIDGVVHPRGVLLQ